MFLIQFITAIVSQQGVSFGSAAATPVSGGVYVGLHTSYCFDNAVLIFCRLHIIQVDILEAEIKHHLLDLLGLVMLASLFHTFSMALLDHLRRQAQILPH